MEDFLENISYSKQLKMGWGAGCMCYASDNQLDKKKAIGKLVKVIIQGGKGGCMCSASVNSRVMQSDK